MVQIYSLPVELKSTLLPSCLQYFFFHPVTGHFGYNGPRRCIQGWFPSTAQCALPTADGASKAFLSNRYSKEAIDCLALLGAVPPLIWSKFTMSMLAVSGPGRVRLASLHPPVLRC